MRRQRLLSYLLSLNDSNTKKALPQSPILVPVSPRVFVVCHCVTSENLKSSQGHRKKSKRESGRVHE
jgi:hypothetical protein